MRRCYARRMTRIALLASFICICCAPAAAEPRPLHYDRAIQPADLDGRTLRELTLMRNWPFAQAGQPFRKKWLRDYFTKQPWYKPVAINEVKKLSELDSKNAAAIAKYETNISRDELKKRRDALASGKQDEDARVESMLINRALGGGKSASPDENRSPLDDPSMLDRLLDVDQLKDLSRRDLRVLRNMVYARHGRHFKSQILQTYFYRMEWYQEDPSYSDAKLSKTDQRNIKLIRSVEDAIGGPMSDDEQKQEEGWFAAA